MRESPVVLEASNLSKMYRRGPEEIHALQGVDLFLSAGEVVALVGPSGCGKTTLLNILAGWEHPDTGEISWKGAPLSAPEDLRWGELAIVPQSLGLIEELSVRENVELPVRLRKPRSGAAGTDGIDVDRVLGDFGLSSLGERLPSETSLGEQQRTALARALVLSPRLLMADEPTGHQDVVWTRGVLRALRGAASEGTCCLVATHHRPIVRFADRVLAIRGGRVEAVDAADEVAAGEEL
ncbi:MAG: ATP-binding cassette domain-containing protein [Actinobacteria bacterium]|nr:ATP-binding cassette domain-containing protein [Actinomycetota bacterium]